MLKKAFILFFLLLQACLLKAQIIDTVCAANKGEVYKVKPNEGSTYFWQVECGNIVTSVIGDSILVDWCDREGIFEIRVVEVNKFGCPGDTVKAKVLIVGGIMVAIEGPTDICRGDFIQLRATGASTFIWSDGTRGPIFFTHPDKTDQYWVVGFNGKCKPDTAFWTVKVHEKPVARFSFNPKNPAVNEKVRFHYEGTGGDEWYWYFDDQKQHSNEKDIDRSFSAAGNKKITLHVLNKAGCEDTATYWLAVKNEAHLYAPTVFTPNNDRQNDVFKPLTYNILDLKMQIYNRWGELLYEGEGLDAYWDGTFRGEQVQEGVYIFMIQAIGIGTAPIYLDGSITLLR